MLHELAVKRPKGLWECDEFSLPFLNIGVLKIALNDEILAPGLIQA